MSTDAKRSSPIEWIRESLNDPEIAELVSAAEFPKITDPSTGETFVMAESGFPNNHPCDQCSKSPSWDHTVWVKDGQLIDRYLCKDCSAKQVIEKQKL
jgi:hypothetical protein